MTDYKFVANLLDTLIVDKILHANIYSGYWILDICFQQMKFWENNNNKKKEDSLRLITMWKKMIKECIE